uniref:G-protein coupled receptor 112 n=1 Tax=Denticeps clupeoides TaxID=299321 RepID=A0AAY4BIS5_9TELE
FAKLIPSPQEHLTTSHVGGDNMMEFLIVTHIFLLPQNVSGMSLYDFVCVYWDNDTNDWNNRGCFKTDVESRGLQCRCNHTTNFAVLMVSAMNKQVSNANAESLNWISIVGCSVSILALLITVIYQIISRKERKSSPTMLLVSICMCMLIFYFLFLFGIENSILPEVSQANKLLSSDLHQDPDRGLCTAVTALLQYFLLATFTWNTLYGVNIFLLIKRTLSGPPAGFFLFSVLIGWGRFPLTEHLEHFDCCWLAAQDMQGNFDFNKPMLWGFLLPVALMLLFNTVCQYMFSIEFCNDHKSAFMFYSTNKPSLMKKYLSTFSLSVVLGLSWVLGYLVLTTSGNDELYTTLSIAFCLSTTTQGLQIFIFFTATDPVFKKTIADALRSVSVPEIPLHTMKYRLWIFKDNNLPELYQTFNSDFSSNSYVL